MTTLDDTTWSDNVDNLQSLFFTLHILRIKSVTEKRNVCGFPKWCAFNLLTLSRSGTHLIKEVLMFGVLRSGTTLETLFSGETRREKFGLGGISRPRARDTADLPKSTTDEP